MSATGCGTLNSILPTGSAISGGACTDAPNRRIASEPSLCRGQNAFQNAQTRRKFIRSASCIYADEANGNPRNLPQARTSKRYQAHPVYPYLLRNLSITRSNHVWAADITYIPMKRGFVYLFAVIDWASRRVLSWRLSNTLTTDFCIEGCTRSEVCCQKWSP